MRLREVYAANVKPGDVALVRYRYSEGPWVVGIATTPQGNWRTQEHGTTFEIAEARPLVVIDPEDREQVERLAMANRSRLELMTHPTDTMQAALREFANPTPPKPDEPQGLGAVVEDAGGYRWVRTTNPNVAWHCSELLTHFRAWADISAVRVLSEGVS